MITGLHFQNFRGFTQLSISPLKQINLITGANNTGKTGILEGLFLLFNGNQQLWPIQSLPGIFRSSLAGMPNQFNQDDYTTFWESLFHDRQTTMEPKIIANNNQNTSFVCMLKFHQGGIQILDEEIHNNQKELIPTLQVVPIRPGQVQNQPQFTWTVNINGQVGVSGRANPFAQEFIILSTRLEHPIQDADLFNQVSLLEGGEEKLLNLLKQIDPRLQKLRYAKAPRMSQPLVYAHFGMKNAISITQTGQGFSKLFSLFCRMLLSKAKIVFIDEIENGLYYETLPEIWKGIAALAHTEKIQIFATTHSRECILAAHETMKATTDYNFALHRLQRVKGNIEAITHDKEMLEAAVKSGLEVR
jgi:predicted ATP-dependent endonuclease of OLD family